MHVLFIPFRLDLWMLQVLPTITSKFTQYEFEDSLH